MESESQKDPIKLKVRIRQILICVLKFEVKKEQPLKARLEGPWGPRWTLPDGLTLPSYSACSSSWPLSIIFLFAQFVPMFQCTFDHLVPQSG